MKQRADRMRLISIIGLVFSGVLIIIGIMTMSTGVSGPEPIMLGVIILGGSVVLLSRSRHAQARDDAAEASPPADSWWAPENIYERILLWGGAAALVVGGIVSIAAADQIASERRGAEILAALGGGLDLERLTAGPTGWSYLGWALLGLGAVMILIWVAQRAGASRRAVEAS